MVINYIKRILKSIYSLLAVIIFIVIWEIAPRVGIVDSTFLPSFSTVISALWELIIKGTLIKHILKSLERSILGFGFALLIAIPLGLVIGWFKKFEKFIDPLLQTFRQTSALALFPVFILLFGIGEVSKVAIIFWGVQWPILLSTIAGVKNVEPILIKSARSMGVTPIKLFKDVIIPAAFPSIFTGIRLSASSSILILIAAEMIGANAGLGFLIYQSEVTFETANMYAAILTIALVGLVVNYSLVFAEKHLMKWKEDIPIGQ